MLEECAPLFGMCQPESVKLVHALPITSAVAVLAEKGRFGVRDGSARRTRYHVRVR
ncbi:MAG: hypothetical protein O3B04_09310 [Chloroflexi bacterium]|nr:hypothetical protein [Chloroflexota bacterium]MDA1298175.1 hypothetical protein [Chloroflexota bacterium]